MRFKDVIVITVSEPDQAGQFSLAGKKRVLALPTLTPET
jgi:hypothetical protein